MDILNCSIPDILVITETHFKVRFKTPQKYFLVAKSKTVYKTKDFVLLKIK